MLLAWGLSVMNGRRSGSLQDVLARRSRQCRMACASWSFGCGPLVTAARQIPLGPDLPPGARVSRRGFQPLVRIRPWFRAEPEGRLRISWRVDQTRVVSRVAEDEAAGA